MDKITVELGDGAINVEVVGEILGVALELDERVVGVVRVIVLDEVIELEGVVEVEGVVELRNRDVEALEERIVELKGLVELEGVVELEGLIEPRT